jgi:type I restriction enzyme, S subunit
VSKSLVKLENIVLVNPSSWSKKDGWKHLRYLDTGNVTKGQIDQIVVYDPEVDKIPSRAKRIVENGDLVYSTVRPVKKHHGLLKDIPDNLVVSTGFAVLRSKYPEKFDTRYIYHLITQEFVTNYLQGIAENNTTAYPALNPSDLTNLEFEFPSIKVQKSVSDFIGALDDKIEVNQKMNQTLEEIAKAIFKSWFVDFDPVHAKAEGRSTGLSQEISDLFPDELVDSEVGQIPKGWNATPLNEFFSPKDERVGERLIKEFSSTNMGIQPRDAKYKKKLSASSAKNKVAHKGDFVFGLSRALLNFGLMLEDIGAFSSAYKIYEVSRGFQFSRFIYRQFLIKPQYYYQAVSASSREGQSISQKSLLGLKVLVPTDSVLEKFNSLELQLWEKRGLLTQENKVLSELRDTLLPKLISGELRVPDAEKFLEEAGV